LNEFRYLSVCSGIEAASIAWHPLGWKPAAFSEIEKFPRAVLAHHYPEVPCHGDFTTIEGNEYGPIDLVCGGTPCQDYSIAGLRAGLDGQRGNLTLGFSDLAYRTGAAWLVWENVPGVFSSNAGRDFGAILATFSGRHGLVFEPPAGGWRNSGVVEQAGPDAFGLAWRVLDAQYFGVPQRRRRIFLVGYLGDWRRAAAVLFERHGLQGHPAPRREAGQNAPTIPSRSSAGGGLGTGFDCDGGLIAAFGGNNTSGPIDVATALSAHGGPHRMLDFESETFIAHSLRGEGFDASEDGTGRGTPLVPVAFSAKDYGADAMEDCSPTLLAGGHTSSHANAGVMPAICAQVAEGGSVHRTVRRVTPRECERLQGFPEIHRTARVLICKSEDEKTARAKFAEAHSAVPALEKSAPVAVNVLIDLERRAVRLDSLGKSSWFANIADVVNSSPQLITPDAFARLLALMHDAAAPSLLGGRAASQANTNGSSHLLNGSVSALLCGHEIDELARDAEQFTSVLNRCLKFTISELGQDIRLCGSNLQTLVCCVSTVISGSIPAAMRNACSYEVRLTTTLGYTAIPWRGKPAEECPDGPRYKALGNSWAVPVARWVGERIAMVDRLIPPEEQS